MTLTESLNQIKNSFKIVKNTPKTCPICQDKGVVYEKNERGVPVKIRECECVKQDWYKSLIIKSGLKEKLEECTFESFEVDNDNLKYAKQVAIDYVTDEKAKALLLLGKSGTGKTHLATAVCGKLLNDYKQPILYVRYRDLMQELKGLTLDLEERNRFLDRYKQVKYLYIDDLFKNIDMRYLTERQYIFELLDYRYSKHLNTIITSEYTIKQLLEIDEAVIGRLGERADGYIVQFNKVANYRAKKMEKDRARKYQQVMGG